MSNFTLLARCVLELSNQQTHRLTDLFENFTHIYNFGIKVYTKFHMQRFELSCTHTCADRHTESPKFVTDIHV